MKDAYIVRIRAIMDSDQDTRLYECPFHEGYLTDPVGLSSCLHAVCRECADRGIDPNTCEIMCPICFRYSDRYLVTDPSPTFPLWGPEWRRYTLCFVDDCKLIRDGTLGKWCRLNHRVKAVARANILSGKYTQQEIANLFNFDVAKGVRKFHGFIRHINVGMRLMDRDAMRRVVVRLAQGDVVGVDVSGLDLTDLRLDRHSLKRWNWTGTQLEGTDLSHSILSDAVGLDQAEWVVPRAYPQPYRPVTVFYDRFVVQPRTVSTGESRVPVFLIYDRERDRSMKITALGDSNVSQYTVLRYPDGNYALFIADGTWYYSLIQIGEKTRWVLPDHINPIAISHTNQDGVLWLVSGLDVYRCDMNSGKAVLDRVYRFSDAHISYSEPVPLDYHDYDINDRFVMITNCVGTELVDLVLNRTIKLGLDDFRASAFMVRYQDSLIICVRVQHMLYSMFEHGGDEEVAETYRFLWVNVNTGEVVASRFEFSVDPMQLTMHLHLLDEEPCLELRNTMHHIRLGPLDPQRINILSIQSLAQTDRYQRLVLGPNLTVVGTGRNENMVEVMRNRRPTLIRGTKVDAIPDGPDLLWRIGFSQALKVDA